MFPPLIHKTYSVPSGGLFINIERQTASQLPFSCWFCHRCPSVLRTASCRFLDRGGQGVLAI